MSENWLENGLKNKLGDYDSPMNLEDAWNALESKRQPKKKKRYFFIWWISGLLVLSGMGGYFYFEKNENSKVSNLDQFSFLEKNKKYESSDNNTFTKIASKQFEEKNNLEQSNIHQINAKSDNEISAIDLDKKTESTPKFIINKNKSKEFNSILNPVSPTLLFSKKSKSQYFLEKKIEDKNSKIEINSTNQIIQKPISVQLLPHLNIRRINSINNENLVLNNNTFTFSKEEKEIVNSKFSSKNKSYFGLSSGYGFRSEGKVQSKEKGLDEFTVNLFFEKYLTKKLFIKTGINFSQFNNRLQHKIEDLYTQSLDNQVLVINQFQDGTTGIIYGIADVMVSEKTNFEIFNRYQFVNIPLSLGYEILDYKKGSLQFETGVSVSALGNYNGKILSNSTDKIFDNLQDLNLKKTGIWSGFYDVQWNFLKLNNKSFRLFINYKGTFHFNKIGSTENLGLEKFRSHQFLFGMKFRL